MARPSPQLLSALRERIRAVEAGEAPPRVLPFGAASLDAALPGGGLALGALHEVAGAGPDEEDGAVAAAFAAGILARLAAGGQSGSESGQVLWCLAGDDLYGPGLAAAGLVPPRLVLARTRGDAETLWAMEEALRDRFVVGVLGEVATFALTAGRRLQLAAEASGVTALVLRRWRVELLRCRGGIPGSWIVEGCDASGHVALPAELADRPDRAAGRGAGWGGGR
jgi:protein ImuA